MKRIPTGIENFKEMIDNDAYYIDKTNLIGEVLKEKVVAYTRPRRFGKTLNMSMLYYFFSNKEKDNAYLFDGLNISKNKEAMKHQNQYPVIFISLKDMNQNSLEKQLLKFKEVISFCSKKYLELLDSPFLLESEKELFKKYVDLEARDHELESGLLNLSYYLNKHYHQKVIILIDEYDVPLQVAYQNGYYDEMVDFLRSVFSSALKTNDALEKGIMTGCLRISKESIFTGLNNLTSYSILDPISSEFFGFTEEEVKQLLRDYHLFDYFDEVKEYYNGYLFGNVRIYNPWSILCYVKFKTANQGYEPGPFWGSTSGNDLIDKYIETEDQGLRNDFDQLMNGVPIEKVINTELTYQEMNNMNNIYSFLLLTGYLTIVRKTGYDRYQLIIPNREIYGIYKQSYIFYFKDLIEEKRNELYQELTKGHALEANELLNDLLIRSISYSNQESFYFKLLKELFNDHEVESKREEGYKRFELCVLPKTILGTLVLIECKHSKSDNELIADAKAMAKQIVDENTLKEKQYGIWDQVIGYAIAFNKKQCFVVKA